MKKILVLLLLGFLSCSSLTGPEYTANKFFDLLQEGNMKEAKLYATSKTNNIMSMIFKEDKMAHTEFKVQDCITKGNKSICTLIIRDMETDEEKRLDLSLVKRDGSWLVDMNKDMLGEKDEALESMKNMNDLLNDEE